jgi:CRP/FNR family transcriptional regulator, cyclic AMP receptor protein
MTLPDPLTEIGWLKEAPAVFQQALLGAASTRHFDAGTTIWQAGDTDFGLLGIRSGNAGVLHAMSAPGSPFGHIVGPGYWSGEGPFLSGKPKTVTLVARTHVEAAMVPQRRILALLTSHPDYWQQIGRLALINGQLASVIASDLMIPSSRRRCAATLLRLAGCRFNSPALATTPVIAVAQEELGAMANLTRHTAGPILHGFAKAGLIRLGYRTITIDDGAALRAIADGG